MAPFAGTSPDMTKLAGDLKSQHVYAFSRFNMLWVCPPLVISSDELSQGLDIVEKALALVDEELLRKAELEEVNYAGR